MSWCEYGHVPTLPTHTHLPWQRINIGERCVNSINHFLELIAKEVKTLLGAVCSERMHLDDQVQCRQLSMYWMTGTQLSVHVFQTTCLLCSRPSFFFLEKVLCRVCQMFPIYMYICSAQSRKFAQSRDCAAQSQNPETVRQSRDCAAPVHNLEIKQFLLRTQVEFPSCITVRNVRKELLQLRRPINVEHVVKLPMPETSGKFTNSEKLPSPRSGYGRRETPDLWSSPVQGFTILESSQLSSISKLRRSYPVSC